MGSIPQKRIHYSLANHLGTLARKASVIISYSAGK